MPTMTASSKAGPILTRQKMPRYNPQDDWFAFYYKKWRTSPDVQKMTLAQQIF